MLPIKQYFRLLINLIAVMLLCKRLKLSPSVADNICPLSSYAKIRYKLYILPFKVSRLDVIKKPSGGALDSYVWNEVGLNQNVLSGLLTAIRTISHELLKMGELGEVHLQEGILILDTSENVVVDLVSSKSSKYLRSSLKKFTQEFEKQFGELVKANYSNLDQYEPTKQLVESIFSNIPHQ